MTETSGRGERAVLWTPSEESIAASQLMDFRRMVAERCGAPADGDFRDLWRWSVTHLDEFWEAMWEFAGLVGERGDGPVREGDEMPGVRWFPGATVNYAANILRWADEFPDAPALIGLHEDSRREVRTWAELRDDVAALAAQLREWGVGPGDRVCAVLPNSNAAVTALLATASVGAIWSVVGSDFGVKGVEDRFGQLEPTVLITVDGVLFNGTVIDLTGTVDALRTALPSVRHHILVDDLAGTAYEVDLAPGTTPETVRLSDVLARRGEELVIEETEFSHPLWVLYSSGTTGKPKGIVHSHGGVTIEAAKAQMLHYDSRPGDIQYSAVATTWVVWNVLVNALIRGLTVVTYTGAPFAGGPDRQFRIIAQERVTAFGTGAAVLSAVERSGYSPKEHLDLSSLRYILSTGSPLPDSTWDWVYEHVSDTVKLGSDSGGTDIASAFIGSNPWDPVVRGLLQGPYLAVACDSFDPQGNSLTDELGEFVVTEPMPSMPVCFWGDEDGSRYRSAYFDAFPGVWRHGDWVTRSADEEYCIHGRSDSTINRGGIRMGSADICQVVDGVEGVQASMVVGAELAGGDYYMPLFVVPEPGTEVDDDLRSRIVAAIRSEISPRYVPDEIIAAPAVPTTRTGKLLEIPVKRLLQGADPASANRETAADASVLDWYIDFAQKHTAERSGR